MQTLSFYPFLSAAAVLAGFYSLSPWRVLFIISLVVVVKGYRHKKRNLDRILIFMSKKRMAVQTKLIFMPQRAISCNSVCLLRNADVLPNTHKLDSRSLCLLSSLSLQSDRPGFIIIMVSYLCIIHTRISIFPR